MCMGEGRGGGGGEEVRGGAGGGGGGGDEVLGEVERWNLSQCRE